MPLRARLAISQSIVMVMGLAIQLKVMSILMATEHRITVMRIRIQMACRIQKKEMSTPTVTETLTPPIRTPTTTASVTLVKRQQEPITSMLREI